MTVLFKRKLSFREADKLIARYYDGLTSQKEEKQLATFFRRKNLPERYHTEKELFGYFAKEKAQKSTIRLSMIKVAASIALIFSTSILVTRGFYPQTTYAIVNGTKITDLTIVKNKALSSLSEFSNSEIEGDLNQIRKQHLNIENEVFYRLNIE